MCTCAAVRMHACNTYIRMCWWTSLESVWKWCDAIIRNNSAVAIGANAIKSHVVYRPHTHNGLTVKRKWDIWIFSVICISQLCAVERVANLIETNKCMIIDQFIDYDLSLMMPHCSVTVSQTPHTAVRVYGCTMWVHRGLWMEFATLTIILYSFIISWHVHKMVNYYRHVTRFPGGGTRLRRGPPFEFDAKCHALNASTHDTQHTNHYVQTRQRWNHVQYIEIQYYTQ